MARRQGAAQRLKHALRRWEILIARVDSGLVKLLHVPDVCMPADFLTKFVSKAKLARSLKRATNSGQALPLR